ncbi:MAG: adenylyl-sulfate kinase [Pseudomonadales bacterium]|nr:adenylyl-sulfate kinase [Pseudomonadales bacterium]MCP5216380.1 adenylyl-sulfate kinase [Pseudomonadales bacterium]
MSEPKSKNIVWSESQVQAAQREKILGNKPATLWFTGLSGSGKSTLALATELALVERGINAFILDGDNVRHGLNSNLGFSHEDRTENIRRIGEVCKLLCDAGMIVFSAFISPYRADRDLVRYKHQPGQFIEVLIDAPLEVCESRDVKGLYEKARAGVIPEFTGISAPYEAPINPEITVNTAEHSLEECVQQIISYLENKGFISKQ